MAAVFCTSCFEEQEPRYREWAAYYLEFFRDSDVELWMFNDGPVAQSQMMPGVRVVGFPDRLGRQSLLRFPGWYRSFSRALSTLAPRYRCLAHVESDLFITPDGRDEFLAALRSPGYKTGWSERYRFPEAALQVLNDDAVVQALARRFQTRESWHEEFGFESYLESMNPAFILRGERIEMCHDRFRPEFTYLAGARRSDLDRFLETRGGAPCPSSD